MKLFCAPGRNRTRACRRASTGRSYQTELHRKNENKVAKERPHNTAITCRFRVASERASRAIERRKLNPRRSSAERFLFSSVVPPRIELGQLE